MFNHTKNRRDLEEALAQAQVRLTESEARYREHLEERGQFEEQLRRRAEELEKLMDLVPVAIWIANDRDCRQITGNRTANEFYEAGAGENVSANPTPGEPWPQRRFFLGGKELTPEELPMQHAAAQGVEVRNTELDVLLPSGKWIAMWGSASPLRDSQGEVRGCLGAFLDITARKRVEKSVQEANERLEASVRERTAELNQLIGTLREEVHQRQQAEQQLQAANDQLNTRNRQLRALAGELTLAERRERRRLARILHDHLQQLLVGARFRLSILSRSQDPLIQQAATEIEELLDASIAASRSLTAELSPPILHEGGLDAGLQWLARWMAEKHGLTVGLETGDGFPDLSPDLQALLFESLRELLFNAVKHARVSTVQVSLRTRGSEVLEIAVRDQGRGFDPGLLKPAGEVGGGFGLFNIRERLTLLGGKMEIDSAPGNGTEIILTLPFDGHPAREAATLASVPEKGTGPTPLNLPCAPGVIRVLIADDHAVVRDGLARVLNQEPDIEIVGEAADGQAAVEQARALSPDVILMDLSMPRLNGVEATRRIHEEYPEIRIIGLSMFEEAERAQAMRNAGAVHYLSKSAPTVDLTAAIRSADRAQTRRQAQRPATIRSH
jgi:signal transduction histidine kinase/CheY-like chemotaxis protein